MDTSTQLVPVPPGCSQPDDFGSALIADKFGEGVVQLSDDSCGAVALETSSPWSVLMQVLKAPPAAFNNGVHSHPVFESATSNLYYLNFQVDVFSGPQQVCCFNFLIMGACWPGADYASGCGANLPAISVSPESNITWRWTWMALGLDSDNNNLYISMSGSLNEDPLNRARAGRAGGGGHDVGRLACLQLTQQRPP